MRCICLTFLLSCAFVKAYLRGVQEEGGSPPPALPLPPSTTSILNTPVAEAVPFKSKKEVAEAREGIRKVLEETTQTATELAFQFTARVQATFREVYATLLQEKFPDFPEHAVLQLGSGSRFLMSPFSDIEFALAFETPEDVKKALKALGGKTNLQLLEGDEGGDIAEETEGEFDASLSPLYPDDPEMAWASFKVDKTLQRLTRIRMGKMGIVVDPINMPSVFKGTVGDVQKMARAIGGRDKTVRHSLFETAWMGGSSKIAFDLLRPAVETYLSSPKFPRQDMASSILKDLVLKNVPVAKRNLCGVLAPSPEEVTKKRIGVKTWDIKKDLLRPLHASISALVVFFDAHRSSTSSDAPYPPETFDSPQLFHPLVLLDRLADKTRKEAIDFPEALNENFRLALEATLRARLLSHSRASAEVETLCMEGAVHTSPESKTECDNNLFEPHSQPETPAEWESLMSVGRFVIWLDDLVVKWLERGNFSEQGVSALLAGFPSSSEELKRDAEAICQSDDAKQALEIEEESHLEKRLWI
uniref:Uncharacterized protein n=1 Tax=Chromera velia CCMP2878 TaxID=1169474 RepID=A0A0G4HIC3_9ALVE|eukprot:Cvel_6947.t1-p1 / transcript=Cvel_6947.t1 / gene=Cvel_6947 / organism=Chromera_velia_CCMP2878 / gene_product=hypothetical protein / transcript_product=hypothetical protein / location=Cvel_scaffold352:35105-36694(+) / protein_length=530 / sequence_SO=supercontig / SO=protein_coding / is_pseudo=false